MKTITLTQGKVALVDDSDFENLKYHKWYAIRDHSTGRYYAARKVKLPDGRRTSQLMHREILGLKHGDKRQGDHIETEQTLDNRRENLRIATNAQNCANKLRRRDNKSGYKGIGWSEHEKAYVARIAKDGKRKRLGSRKTAALAWLELYWPASIAIHGEFGRAL